MITYHWSRIPGDFVNRASGESVVFSEGSPFQGTVRMWYETLIETLIDVRNAGVDAGQAPKNANVTCRVGRTMLTVLESSVLYRTHHDPDKKALCANCAVELASEVPEGYIGTVFTVVLDESQPKNEIAVGSFGKVVVLDPMLS